MSKYEEAFVIVKHHFNGSDCNYCQNKKCETCRFTINNDLLLDACKKAQLYDELNEKVQKNYKGYFTPNNERIVLDEKLLDQYYRMEMLLEKYVEENTVKKAEAFDLIKEKLFKERNDGIVSIWRVVGGGYELQVLIDPVSLTLPITKDEFKLLNEVLKNE